MSIYYNMKILPNPHNDTNTEVNFEDFLESPLINNQSEYSVGVKRFKIPISNVDEYRVYENEQLLSILCGYTYRHGGTTANDDKNGRNLAPVDIFSVRGWNSKDYDPNIDFVPHSKTTRTGRYIPISSPVEYCNLITRAMAANAVGGVSRNTRPTMVDATTTIKSSNLITLASSGTWTPLATIAPTAVGNARAGYLTGFDCVITGWKPVDSGVSATNGNQVQHRVSDLQFRLRVGTGNDQILIYLGEGMFPSIDRVEKWTDDYGFGSPSNSATAPKAFGFSTSGRISYEKAKFNESGFNASVLDDGTTNYHLFHPSNYDDLDLLLRQISGKEVSFEVRDMACLGVGTPSLPGTTPLNEYSTTISGYLSLTEQDLAIPTSGTGDDINYIDFFPRFSWNDTSKKIEFLCRENWFATFALWGNSGLINAMDFPIANRITSNKTTDVRQFQDANAIYKTLFSKYVYNDKVGIGNELCGGIFAFRNSENSFTERNIFNPTQTTTIYVYGEQSPSTWKRTFLWGLEFVSNRLAVNGEVANNGKAMRKIITDFEIDPKNTDRDYLVYSPSGDSVRYYALRTTSELNAVDVKVNFVDRYGNRHPLYINNNECASVKLEFKPNALL
jgi:hypothetical protein